MFGDGMNNNGINQKITAYMQANSAAVNGLSRQQVVSIMMQQGCFSSAELSQLSAMLSGGRHEPVETGLTIERSTETAPPSYQAKILEYAQTHPNCMQYGTMQDLVRRMQREGVLSETEAAQALREIARFDAAVDRTSQHESLEQTTARSKASQHNLSENPVPTGKGKELAQSLIDASSGIGAVSHPPFINIGEELKKLSTADLVEFMGSFDKDESLMEMVFDEAMSSPESKKFVCEQVFKVLRERAELLGIDLGDIPEQFSKKLNADFRYLYVETDTLDKLTSTVVAKLESHINLEEVDRGIISRKDESRGNLESNRALQRRLEQTYANFGERVDAEGNRFRETPDGQPYNGQLQRDGWTGDVADGFKCIWGSENTADNVRKDLQVAAQELERLEAARAEGAKKYAEVFEDIFKVPYDYTHIYAYQKAEAQYIRASQANEREQKFNDQVSNLLSGESLEVLLVKNVPASAMTGGYNRYTQERYKEVFYEEEYSKFAELLPNGKEFLDAAFKKRGVENGTIDEKYKVMQEIAKAISKQMNAETVEAGGGKSYAEVSERYERAYASAYGATNDVMRRVNDYIVSQQIGSEIVKGVVVAGATIGAALSGGSLASVALVAAGTSLTVGVTDTATRGDVLKTLRDKGVTEASIEAYEKMDWEKLFKDSAVAGVSVLVGGGVTKGVSVCLKGARPATQVAAEVVGDGATDGAIQWVTEGTVTVDGVVLSVVLSGAGNYVQHRVTHIDGVPVKGSGAKDGQGSAVVPQETLESVTPRSADSESTGGGAPKARGASDSTISPSAGNATPEAPTPSKPKMWRNRPIPPGFLKPLEDFEKIFSKWFPNFPNMRGILGGEPELAFAGGIDGADVPTDAWNKGTSRAKDTHTVRRSAADNTSGARHGSGGSSVQASAPTPIMDNFLNTTNPAVRERFIADLADSGYTPENFETLLMLNGIRQQDLHDCVEVLVGKIDTGDYIDFYDDIFPALIKTVNDYPIYSKSSIFMNHRLSLADVCEMKQLALNDPDALPLKPYAKNLSDGKRSIDIYRAMSILDGQAAASAKHLNPNHIISLDIGNGNMRHIRFMDKPDSWGPPRTSFKPKEIDDLINSNMITTDLVKLLQNHPEIKVKSAEADELIKKAQIDGVESLSPHELHIVTDSLRDLYKSNDVFKKALNAEISASSELRTRAQSIYRVVDYLRNSAESGLAEGNIGSKFKLSLSDHALMRMLDRDMCNVVDNSGAIINYPNFIKLIEEKVRKHIDDLVEQNKPIGKEFEIKIPGYEGSAGITLKVDYDGKNNIIVNTIF